MKFMEEDNLMYTRNVKRNDKIEPTITTGKFHHLDHINIIQYSDNNHLKGENISRMERCN